MPPGWKSQIHGIQRLLGNDIMLRRLRYEEELVPDLITREELDETTPWVEGD